MSIIISGRCNNGGLCDVASGDGFRYLKYVIPYTLVDLHTEDTMQIARAIREAIKALVLHWNKARFGGLFFRVFRPEADVSP